jgi:Flp pilus assembly secretin CpaC
VGTVRSRLHRARAALRAWLLHVGAPLVLAIIAAGLLVTPAVAQTLPGHRPLPTDRLRGVTLADGTAATSAMAIIRGQHLRLLTTRALQRVASGDPDVIGVEVLNSTEALVLGRRAGSTSLILWYQDNTSDAMHITVHADIAVLAAALTEIHPSITVEAAPDRPALVLRGVVPDLAVRRAAEEAARSYLRSATSEVLVADEPPAPPPVAPGAERADALRSEPPPAAVRALRERGRRVTAETAVINLIRLTQLPPTVEERIRTAIRPVGGQDVTVRRIVRGVTPSDDDDAFVLEGTVASQVALIRILSVASRTLGDANVSPGDGRADIRVIADEGGAIAGTAGQSSGIQTSGGFSFGGAGTLTSGSSSTRRLTNLVHRNVGRARGLSAANGRLLSFIDVGDLPQVRVNARLYEIQRTRLLDYSPQVRAFTSSRGQPVLDPPRGIRVTRPDGTPGFVGQSGDQILSALSFLSGLFTSQTQLVVGQFALDALLSVLESEGIARQLSAPSLTVLSGEVAEFSVGGEIPIVESFLSPAVATTGTAAQSSAAVGTGGVFNTVTFKPFGVSLGVRPLVGEDDAITIDVVPEVTTPDPQLTLAIRESTGAALPTTAFESRSLRTTTQLRDGQAILIGGLVTRDLRRTDGAAPILSSVPLLRYFFKSFRDQDDQTELVVVVSPAIVRTPVGDAPLWAFPATTELPPTAPPLR